MKVTRILFGLLITFSIFFTAFYGSKQINAERLPIEAENYKSVISMWQIDSFEGGVGSRKQFLLKVARDFEKKYNGIFIMVTNMTKEGVEDNVKNGIFPDIISYGNGVNIQNISEFNCANTVKSGLVGNKTYATAWCRGGYALITNPNYKKTDKANQVLVSQAEYTQPLISMLFNDVLANEIEVLSPMDAYVKFVSGKVEKFIGTQRDINRLEARGMQVEVTGLNVFNDLYQYVSICTNDQLKRYYAEEFVNYLVSEKVQKSLNNIGMFSCFYQVEYDNEHLRKLQEINYTTSLSAFIPEQNLKELQRMSILAVGGDEQAKIKIKNMTI